MITVEEVQNIQQKKEFLNFPARLYQHDKNYIRPLDKDINDVFNPEKINFMQTENVLGSCLKTNLKL